MMSSRQPSFVRLVIRAVALATVMIGAVPLVQAQTPTNGGWTLNITDPAQPVLAGGEVPFAIRITNSANAGIDATTATFTIPAKTVFLGVDGLDCTPLPGVPELTLVQSLDVVCLVPAIAYEGELAAKVRLRPMDEGDITFVGKIRNPNDEANAPGPSEQKVVAVQKGADIALGLSVVDSPVKGGSWARFSATVTNNGPFASSGATVSIPVPAGLSPAVTLPSGCRIAAGASPMIICEIAGPIAVGSEVNFDFKSQVTVGDVSTITISGEVSSANAPFDPISSNNGAHVNLDVEIGTDVTLQKTRTPTGLLVVGQAVDFVLLPEFAGTVPAVASISDDVPGNYEVLSVVVPVGSGWTCSTIGNAVSCTFAEVVDGNFKAPITIKTTAIAATATGSPVTNHATIVSAQENDDMQDNNGAVDGAADIALPTVDLVASKSGSRNGLLAVGNTYDYVLRTQNQGNSGFYGPLTITDILPEGLTVTAITPPLGEGWACDIVPPGGFVGPARVSCSTDHYTDLLKLEPNESTSAIVFQTKVTQAGSLVNGMLVSFDNYENDDSNPSNNTTQVNGRGEEKDGLADLVVIKSVASPSNIVVAGDEIEFAIEVVNKGPSVATNVVLDDRLGGIVAADKGGVPKPVVPKIIGNSASDILCRAPASGGYSIDLRCDIGTLPVCVQGNDCPIFYVKVRPGGEGAKTNTAVVFSTDVPDSNLADNESTASYTVTPMTDLAAVKQSPSSASGARAGQPLVYTVTASVLDNGLSGAKNVIITDTLPDGLYFVSAVVAHTNLSCDVSGINSAVITGPGNNKVICSVGDINNGSQRTAAITVIPTTNLSKKTITNNIVVKTVTPDIDDLNNSTSLPVRILEPVLNLSVTKTDGILDPVLKGEDTVYLITASNAGPSDANNVKIVDTLPLAGFADPSWSGSSAGLTCVATGVTPGVPGGTVTCSIDRLKAGQSVSFNLAMKSLERGLYRNEVIIKSDETEADYEGPKADNKASEGTTVRVKSDVSVVKVADTAAVELREEFSWTLTVSSLTGSGYEVAENVTLTDTLPVGMELTQVPDITPDAPAASCTGAVGTRVIACSFGDMEPGTQYVVKLHTKITDVGTASQTNSATVATDSFDQNRDNDTDDDSVGAVHGSSVSGMIYRDFDGKNSQDLPHDTGIASVPVTLSGPSFNDGVIITRTVNTDADGKYSFIDLPPGTYSVSYGAVPDAGRYPSGNALPGSSSGTTPTKSAVNVITNIKTTANFAAVNHNFTLVPEARIGLSKVAGAITVNADGTYSIPYTLTVKNYSLEPLAGISVTDILNGALQNFGTDSGGVAPTEGQYQVTSIGTSFGTLNAGFNGATSTGVVTAGKLAAGAQATLTLVVLVNPVVPRIVPALVHTNQAEVTGTGEYSGQTPTDLSNNTSNPDPNNNGIPNEAGENNPTEVTPDAGAAVTLGKVATPRRTTGNPTVGDIVDYVFTITNSGKTALLNVTVTDPKVGLVWTANTPIARLEPGASNNTAYLASYVLTQADIDSGSVANTAGVTGQWGITGSTPVNVTNTATATVPALSKPGLTIVKTLDSAAGIGNPRTEVGDIARYRFVVTNTGNTTLNSVSISDALSGVVADPAGSFTIGTMAPGAVVTRYATYPVNQINIDAGKVTNSATAGGTYGPSNTPITTPASSVDVPLYRQASLTLAKALTSTIPAIPLNGTTVTWSVTATNTGNVTLTNLVVSDPYPDAVVTPASLASLAPGASYSFTVTAPLQQTSINSGSLDNTATINADTPTGPLTPVDASTTTPLPDQTPKIALKKNADLSGLSTPPQEGELIAYTIVIRNTGNVPLDTITLADLLADVQLNAADMAALSTVVLQPQNFAGTAMGTEITVRATYALKTVDIEAGSVINTAVTTGTSVPNPGQTVTDRGGTTFETDDPTETVLARDPTISLTKSISNAALSTPPAVGDIITYAFTITNTGNVNLDTIDLTDAVTDVTMLNPSGWAGPLAPGASNSTAFTATYALKQADIDLGQFVNTATVVGEGIGATGTTTTVNDSSSATQTLARATGLTLVKSEVSNLSTPPKIGDRIDYSFVLINTGNTTLTNLVVNDLLVGLVWDTAYQVATLLPGTANAVTLNAHYILVQSDIQAGKVDNRASATYNDPTGPQTPVDSDLVTVPLTQVPGIAVVKSAVSGFNDPAVAGELITYSFTVTNTGNLELKGIVLNDPLPRIAPSSFVVGDLLPGETSAVFTATYAIDAADILAKEVVNQANVTGTYDDGSGPKTTTDLSGPTVDTDEPVTVPVPQARPSMTIVKTGSFATTGAYVYVGDVISYEFEVTNTGNVPLSNVTPRELGITFGGQPATGTLEPITPGPQLVAVGGTAVFKTSYALTQDDINHAAGLANGVANRADATAEHGGTPITADPDDAVLSIPTQEPADISIVKRALVSTIRRGETAGFAITVTNNSLADVGLVTITDRMPSGFIFVEGSATVNGVEVTPTVAGQVVTFTDVRLRPSSTVEIGLVLRALPTTPAGVYRNHADGVDAQGTPLAPRAHADVRIEAEGLFECSEVIGTVYNDLNRNGYQDQDEPGIPGVRLSTVRGTLITTDAFGRYSVPCADLPNGNIGSNFVLKIDERTLPSGFSMTTDNPGMVRLTAGKMVELNFGASIGREIRLTLDASAFAGGSVVPGSELQAGLTQVIDLLEEHRTTLFIRYRRGTDGALAQQRVEQIVALIREQWRHAGEPYRLVINTDIVEN